MELDEKAENIIRNFTSQVESIYGDDLVSVILYGSATGREYIPDRSDFNFLVILKEVTPGHLKRCLKYIRKWKKQKISPPLFLDPSYIKSSTDVFPIEFLEMKEQHRTLLGEDILKDLEISQENLRHQCESELKGKWLKLRQIYLEAEGNPKKVEELLISSLKPFGVVLRSLLRLVKEEGKGDEYLPQEFLEIINQIEEEFKLQLDAFREVYLLKQGVKRLERSEVESLFTDYVQEVRELARKTDTLFRR